ncbi:hypothetical protein [Solibacillus cecembensis]|uniref:hypothetical protein n=1 Tax=Solibacillus cecembensis TaxID=459347 RepID=UPI003AA07375
MEKLMMIFIASGLLLVGCSQNETNDITERNAIVVSEISNIKEKIIPSADQNVVKNSPVYLAGNENELSIQDLETGYMDGGLYLHLPVEIIKDVGGMVKILKFLYVI